jgi:hypothetical protein
MKTEYVPPTEIGRQRQAWFQARVKPNMTFEESIRLNDDAFSLFPRTEEERRQKMEDLMAMPEFVL